MPDANRIRPNVSCEPHGRHRTRGVLVALGLAALTSACVASDPACHDFVFREDAGALPPTLSTLLGPTVTADDPPPSLSGGTLITAHDGSLAIASDPDTDRIVVVGTHGPILLGEVALEPRDEPGRLVEDAAGLVHVVLRSGGAIVTLDPTLLAIRARREVCPAPRGIAYDATLDALYVACAGGELITLPAAPDAPMTRALRLADDLRDVVIDGERLLVSRFRSGEVLMVDTASGTVSGTLTLETYGISLARDAATAADVVWRMIRSPEGAFVLYQSALLATPLGGDPSTYGSGRGGCEDSVVRPAMAMIEGNTAGGPAPIPCGALSIDAAISPDGETVAIASAGVGPTDRAAQIQIFSIHPRQGGPRWVTLVGQRRMCPPTAGRVVALTFAPDGAIVVQTRAPATVFALGPGGGSSPVLAFGGPSRADTGFDIFHSSGRSGVACASCHPEGGDDGRVWQSEAIGPRRTMSLRGGVLAGAPFHWTGDLVTFDGLVNDVFDARMGGGSLDRAQRDALEHWLDAQPQLPPRSVDDADAVTRGRAVFEDAANGCTSCHAGERLSDDRTLDVGTGGAFQVPSLRGLAYRAPYMHDGCAATLLDVFDTCGGHRHQLTPGSTSTQTADLAAYLSTL